MYNANSLSKMAASKRNDIHQNIARQRLHKDSMTKTEPRKPKIFHNVWQWVQQLMARLLQNPRAFRTSDNIRNES